MSTSSLSFKQQRKLVTAFIKTYSHYLKGITKTFINKLESADNDEFIVLIENIDIKAGNKYNVFCGNDSCTHLNVWITDTPTESICEWEHLGYYKNITPVRMSNLDHLFTSVFIKKKTKKLAQSKTKQTDSDKSESFVKVKRKIAFLNVSDKSIQHAMNAGGDNIDIRWSSADFCDDYNQIDHVMNSYKCAIKEFRNIINELKLAKAKGATHVIDSTYSKPEHFNF